MCCSGVNRASYSKRSEKDPGESLRFGRARSSTRAGRSGKLGGQTDKFVDGQRFGPSSRIDSRGRDDVRRQEWLERIAQGLAALGESGRDHSLELLALAQRHTRHGQRRKAYDRRLHLGLRIESLRRDLEEHLGATRKLSHNTEPAPVTVSRLRRQALYHLELEHEVHVLDDARGFEQAEDQGRGDVVGEVAYDTQAFASRREPGVVKAKGVGAVQCEARVDTEGSEERRGEIAVELDGVELASRVQEHACEGPEARADLYDPVRCLGVDGAFEAVDY